jgi:hypothetical protein
VINEVDEIDKDTATPKYLSRMLVCGWEGSSYTHLLASRNAARDLVHVDLTAQLLPYLQLGRVGAIQAVEYS